MSTYTLPHFGELDLDSLEEYYDTDIEFGGHEVQLDLNFENTSIDPARLEIVKQFIDNLTAYDANNRLAMEKDFEEGDTVISYLEHHQEELATLVESEDTPDEPKKQMLSKLHLVRAGFYPDSEDQFAIFDYSIGKELTQYLVVLFTNEKGELDYMTMES